MENSAEEIARKRVVVIAAGFGVFILLIFVIWMILGIRWRNNNVTTLNRDEVVSESGLTQARVAAIEGNISNIIEMYYKDKVPGKATMTIRQTMTEDGTEKTLVDVEEIRVTFEMGAVTSCAKYEDAKYKDGFCMTPEGGTTFGNGLPVYSSIEESEEGYRESSRRDTSKDKERWFLDVRENTENLRPRLAIYVLGTCEEDNSKEKYIESVKKYINWLDKGWDTGAFEYEVFCPATPDAEHADLGDKSK